eukprot:scaffold97_cov128-Isochrysis_galbana.AAC.3
MDGLYSKRRPIEQVLGRNREKATWSKGTPITGRMSSSKGAADLLCSHYNKQQERQRTPHEEAGREIKEVRLKRALLRVPHSRQPSPPSQQLAGRGMPAA